MLKYLFMTLIAAMCAACTPLSPIDPIGKVSASPIGLCGGGLDAGIKAGLEAEYQKYKGNIDANFGQYAKAVLNANEVSEKKYENYLACVLEVDKRLGAERQLNACHDTCNTSFQQCKSDTNGEYQQCLRGGQSRCLADCKDVFKLDPAKCKVNCDMGKETNVSRWEVTGKCKATSSQCTASRDACFDGCKAK